MIHNSDQPPLVGISEVRLVTDRKRNITQVIVSLSGGVNPTQAQQLATFRLATAGLHGSFDAKNARTLKLAIGAVQRRDGDRDDHAVPVVPPGQDDPVPDQRLRAGGLGRCPRGA